MEDHLLDYFRVPPSLPCMVNGSFVNGLEFAKKNFYLQTSHGPDQKSNLHLVLQQCRCVPLKILNNFTTETPVPNHYV